MPRIIVLYVERRWNDNENTRTAECNTYATCEAYEGEKNHER